MHKLSQTWQLLLLMTWLIGEFAWAAPLSFDGVDVGKGKILEFGLIKPQKIDPDKMILLLPPGAQDKKFAELGIAKWQDYLTANGYFVVIPLAPGGVLFFRGSEKVIPGFIKAVRHKYQLPRGKFHLVGMSNGGISAFRVATLWPKQFRSLVALPGFAKKIDEDRLDSLGELPVTIFVGAKDTPWMTKANSLVMALRKHGTKAEVKVIGSTGHRVFQQVEAEQLLAVFKERSLSY